MNQTIAENKVLEAIKQSGAVTFARFMELALYHPLDGYYMREGEKIGAAGDFYTSPDVSGLFGRALADQAADMWEAAGRPPGWTLLEQGAGKGNLAKDILEHLSAAHEELFRAMRYLIVEKSPSMKKIQQNSLRGQSGQGGAVQWLNGLEELATGELCGCILSNELLDAFPVHRVVLEDGELKEIWVHYTGDRLAEFNGPLSTPELADYVNTYAGSLEEGQSIEICLELRRWVKEVSRVLSGGFVLSIDYGDTSGALFTLDRPNGTIRAFHGHRLVDDFYEAPGLSDITAHVNFSALLDWGGEEGLMSAGYTTQSRFLLNMGILEHLRPPDPSLKFDSSYAKSVASVKQLIMPGGMGEVFKVAAQCKGFASRPDLRGFGKASSLRA